jgi:hypothetical protein
VDGNRLRARAVLSGDAWIDARIIVATALIVAVPVLWAMVQSPSAR